MRMLLAALFLGFASYAAVATETAAPNAMIEDALDSIGGSVSRAVITTAVVNREPVDKLVYIQPDQRHVYFFTELKGLAGEIISHTWEYGGKIIAESRFEVGGPRWRIWSSNTLQPEFSGDWKVIVRDVAGRIISETRFRYLASE